MATHLNNSWDEILKDEIEQDYFKALKRFLIDEYDHHVVFPPMQKILAAFENTAYEEVKVVILGQDPYYNEGQANRLSFSVSEGIECPPSLVNIYKALEYDLNIEMTTNGDLSGWAKQGVLLLNTVLTVRAKAPQSHANVGWERFTNAVIEMLNKSEKPIVFMLWGNNAKKKMSLLTNKKHLILTAPHPSPLSFYHGFLECKHFSKANAFLKAHNITPIDWSKRSH